MILFALTQIADVSKLTKALHHRSRIIIMLLIQELLHMISIWIFSSVQLCKIRKLGVKQRSWLFQISGSLGISLLLITLWICGTDRSRDLKMTKFASTIILCSEGITNNLTFKQRSMINQAITILMFGIPMKETQKLINYLISLAPFNSIALDHNICKMVGRFRMKWLFT